MHKILEPLLLAVALAVAIFAAAIIVLWRDGRRQKAERERARDERSV